MTSIKEISVQPFYRTPAFWIATGIYVAILAALYYSSLQWLIFHDWVKDDYSYCILISFIVGYLLWEKHRQLMTCKSKPSINGIYFLIAGIILFWLGELAGEFFTTYLSLWLTLFSLCILHMGWMKTRIILFPLLFSLTMFPLPNFVNNQIILQLKLISTKLGVWMMQVYGMSVFREGNIIDLGFTQLQVVDACSGLRYLFSMVVLSILIAYFYKAKLWKRAVIVVSSLP